MKCRAVILVFVVISLSFAACSIKTGKAYSNLGSGVQSNNCVVAETGDEGKQTSCNELCGNVVVPGSETKANCAIGMVYRNDGSSDKATFFPCASQFNPIRNDDGSMNSYLDCYCCAA
ncbi:hypothetical protein HY638_00325 [Candidatus Woesearchaeota archaeon]|nr:hypothetical protein [Candidatus Woesearchaeota archaeon]